MVRVISKLPVRFKRTTCSKCAFELEYTGEDVVVTSGIMMGDLEVSHHIVCPRLGCKEKVMVPGWEGGTG